LQAAKIRLDADVNMIDAIGAAEPNFTPMQYTEARDASIATDPLINALSESIAAVTREQIAAGQMLTESNPMRLRTTERLEELTERLDRRREELEKEFNAELLAKVERQREQVAAQLEAVNALLMEQKIETDEVGETNLEIQDIQFQMAVEQELFDTVTRRIEMLKVERQGLPRITEGYPAQVLRTNDKRVKFSAGLVLAGVGCGFGLALLREKLDKTLQTPADVVRELDLPVIGTTTSSRSVKPKLFAEQIAGDYQTIRTNLGLLSNTGMPKRLAVCSAGMREGKTTFAVNLATSLAKSGKRVLLIDGDLRKPDIGYMLNIPNGSGGLQEVLLGEDPRGVICVVPSSGLHVLAANPRSTVDVYEMLTSPTAGEQVARLAQDYDHVIIDTPPTLAFPDALVWAKLADGVVLVSYAGQTTAPELKETKERFARVRARVLGAVLSNVPVEQGLYRYGYSYRAQSPQAMRKTRKPRKLLLPTHAKNGGRSEDRAS
jgi:capsular exopolysaccharide synthesis family protein